jgi:hypothetical protein
MPNIQYSTLRVRPVTRKRIEQANAIIDEYVSRGFVLTLRQLYYQFVARDLIENTMDSYRRLGKAVSIGRDAGLIDWSAIEDRTRNVVANTHWASPKEIIDGAINHYMLDRWSDQPYQVEVLIEKEALLGVIASTCDELDVPYMACKGYLSQSEMWRLARRVMTRRRETVLLYLGDHDPSGVDMSRYIIDKMEHFGCTSHDVCLKRVALNMDQIKRYKPPPAPVKRTDPRTREYEERYGSECWELDALDPQVMVDLIKENALVYRDEKKYKRRLAKERRHIKKLRELRDASMS